MDGISTGRNEREDRSYLGVLVLGGKVERVERLWINVAPAERSMYCTLDA